MGSIPTFTKTFNFLNEISPIRLELPASSSKLAEYVGNYSSKGESKKGGVYVFTNKLNGFCYVGSSISLSTRLSTGYLGPVLGNRVVDLAIKDTGLENFYLDLYIIPQDLLNLFIKEVSSNDSNVVELEKNKLKFLTLALEQMLILEFNPEYNVLKVAGSGSGFKRSPESMLPSLVKNSKATYVYDNKADQLVYAANSRSELSREIGLSLGTLSRILKEDSLYLNRFILSAKLLNENDSLAEIMNPEEFFKLVSEARED